MRIIAGHLRGRTLEVPPGRGTRPMLDRVREALFSTLMPLLEDARVLDLFAGSGSLGLEALSRGAAAARLVEKDGRACALLRRNVAALDLEESAEVVRGDALDPALWGSEPLDLVFLDPPYPWLKERARRARLFESLRTLVLEHLADDGRLVFHTPRRAVAAVEFGAGVELDERAYGTNALWYVARAAPEGDA